MKVVGQGEQLDVVSNIVCGECFGQEEQAVETQSLRLRESVAWRPSGRSSRDAPRVDDTIWQ